MISFVAIRVFYRWKFPKNHEFQGTNSRKIMNFKENILCNSI